jgi:hypothetical protein
MSIHNNRSQLVGKFETKRHAVNVRTCMIGHTLEGKIMTPNGM